jgi:hypothetical protein
MLKNRLFNVSIIVTLAVVVLLTISQAIETTKVVSAAAISPDAAGCFFGMDRLSLISVYIKEIRSWFPHTNEGPTGVDGGLLDLLSNYHACKIGKE